MTGSAVAIAQSISILDPDYRIALSNLAIYIEDCEYTTDHSQSDFVASTPTIEGNTVSEPYTFTFPSF
jgi:hypothetical protein